MDFEDCSLRNYSLDIGWDSAPRSWVQAEGNRAKGFMGTNNTILFWLRPLTLFMLSSTDFLFR